MLGSTRSIPRIFERALRIVAWQAIYQAQRISALGPRYHCPTCALPEKNLERGCPTCPLSECVQGFRERITEKTAERWGNGVDWPFADWPLDRVLEIYMHVNQMLGENKNRISGKWFEDVAALARVILAERAHAQAVTRFNQP